MSAALALAERGRGRTAPNPNVGCVIVKDGRVVGRGWTQPGGRPHAEAMALAQAGELARGATVYVTLEPCAHVSERGPACSALLVEAGVADVVVGTADPDPRTNCKGVDRLIAAGIAHRVGADRQAADRSMRGYMCRQLFERPAVTLKLATSLDGCIATAKGESKWITGDAARAHGHLERVRHDAILVGRGTYEADSPRLDVRLPGLEERSPRRLVLSRHPGLVPGSAEPQGVSIGEAQTPEQVRGDGWTVVESPQAIANLDNVNDVLVEGGAGAAAAFLRADLVDRLLLYRAPILIGGGTPALGDIGLGSLGEAHGQWRLLDTRMLGIDRLEIYERVRI